MKTSDQRSASQGAAKTLRRPARRQSKGMSADRGLKSKGKKNTLGSLIQIRSGLGHSQWIWINSKVTQTPFFYFCVVKVFFETKKKTKPLNPYLNSFSVSLCPQFFHSHVSECFQSNFGSLFTRHTFSMHNA